MIIDELPSISIANDSDEIPIEQGTATKKITKGNFLQEIVSSISSLISDISGKVSKAGDTMIGELIVQNSAISEKSTTADTTDDAPASITYWDTKHTDKNNRVAAYWETAYSTTGTSRTTLRARRNVNGSNVNNGFALEVNKNGEKFVSFDNPAAWRDALGLAAVNFNPTRNTTNTEVGVAYGIYDPGAKTVRIYGWARNSSGIPLNSQMFSIPSAYRPSATKNGVGVYVYSNGIGTNQIAVNSNGDITQAWSASTTYCAFIIEYTL